MADKIIQVEDFCTHSKILGRYQIRSSKIRPSLQILESWVTLITWNLDCNFSIHLICYHLSSIRNLLFVNRCWNWQKDQVSQSAGFGVHDDDEELFQHWVSNQVLDYRHHDVCWVLCGILSGHLQYWNKGDQNCRIWTDLSECT